MSNNYGSANQFTTESCLDINAYPGSFSSLIKKGEWTGKNINSELLNEWVEITSGKIYQDKNQKYFGLETFLYK